MIFPCNNIGHFLKGEKDQLFKLVNDVPVVNTLQSFADTPMRATLGGTEA